jgi:hypothetical protein
MLALEIPIKFNDKNKLLPLFLKIAEEEKKQKSKSNKSAKNYDITLITELPQIGTIKSKIKVKNKDISALFLSESEQTASLIKNNLERLQKPLEAAGFNIKNLETAKLEMSSSEKNNFFNKIFLAEFDSSADSGQKYTHLDIRV